LKREITQTPGQHLSWAMDGIGEVETFIPLIGNHQVENVRTALAVLSVLKEIGFAFDNESALKGFSDVRWPGRVEIVSRDPSIILDGAHCPLSAAALCETLREWFPARRRILLLGILKVKNAAWIMDEMAQDPYLSHVIFFPPPTPRGIPAVELAELGRGKFATTTDIASSLHEAFQRAKEVAGRDDLIVLAGSLYNIAPAKQILGFDTKK